MSFTAFLEVISLIKEAVEKGQQERARSPACVCGHKRVDHAIFYDGEGHRQCTARYAVAENVCPCMGFRDAAKPLVTL